jgi:predicted nucleic acid-binding protein
MNRAYCDNCCFSRAYDGPPDETEVQKYREYEAIVEIQDMIRNGDLELAWSYVLTDENDGNRDPEKVKTIAAWENRAVISVEKTPEIEAIAQPIMATGIKQNDALHIACAIKAGCRFFITTDRRLYKYHDSRIYICDPIEFLTHQYYLS